MEPITTAIISALSTGAALGGKEIATQALKDAYAGLKGWITSHYLDWPPFLRQTVKTQNSSNGEFELCLEGSSHRSLSWPPCGG